MKARTAVLTLVLCLIASAVCFAAENPSMGTWKLDEAKSKIAPGAAKNTTVTYTAAGDEVKVTTEGVDGSGKPVTGVWTGKMDGKDYPVTGDPRTDMRSVKESDKGYHLDITNKKDGKVVGTATVRIAKDGKSRTLTTKGKDAQGKEVSNTYVYEKQ